jgi:nicotinamide riboside transporter PnuC
MLGIIWSVGLASIGILGLVLAGRKSSIGWAVGLFAQLLWIVYALVTAQYGFILSAVAYGYVYFTNWRKWRKDEQQKVNES